VEARRADFGIRCTACHEFTDGDRSRPPRRRRAPEDVRPWTPWQIAAVSVTFGAGACGAVAGLNFVRLGKRQYLIPSVVAGWVLFAVAGLAMLLVPDQASRLVGLLMNLAVGFGFMLVQKPFFDVWKAVNWGPRPGDRYRPNGLGQLLLVCLVSLGIEIGVVALLAFLGSTW
jgi:hypothetical protein